MFKKIGLLFVILSLRPTVFAEEFSPWDQAFQLFQEERGKGNIESAWGAAGKFLDYGRLGFLPEGDLRFVEVEEFWKVESNKRRVAKSETIPSPQLPSVAPVRPQKKAWHEKQSVETNQTLIKRAERALKNGRFDEAERLIKRSLAINPQSAEAHSQWERLQSELAK